MATETIEELKQQLYSEKKKVDFLQKKLDSFELQGKAKLYYSLNRNMSDLADMLDGIDLSKVDVVDSKDKTMERLKLIWASVNPLVTTISLLSDTAGITGDEKKDTAARKSSFLDGAIK